MKLLKSFQSIPGPNALPFVGTLPQYIPMLGKYNFDTLHLNGMKKFKEFGPIVREEIVPGVNIVWLFRPEDYEILFRHEGRYPYRRSHLALEKYRLDRPHIYNSGGLLPTNGSEWWRLRSIFQKGLSSPRDVQKFITGADEIISEYLDHLAQWQQQYDYLPYISRVFLELTGATFLNIRFGSFTASEIKPNSRSSYLLHSAFATNSSILKTDLGLHIWRRFNTPLYRKLCKAQDCMQSVAIDALNRKLSVYRNPEEQLSLLDLYIASPKVDLKDLIGILCDFILGGIDTASYTTSFVLYYIGSYMNVQEDLYKEACHLLPQVNSPVTSSVLADATYARAVLKETLRLQPISVGIGRILNQDVTINGYVVPAGTSIVTQNQVSCRMENYFKQPNVFHPERWLKRDENSPNPFLVLPFGFGPRSCIAKRLAEQNILILLLKIVRRFRVQWTGGKLDVRTLLTNKPDGPIQLHFHSR